MILAALQVVVDTPTNNAIDNFLAIAKKDIAHAFLVIQKSRIQLYHLLNSNGELANVLLAIEWEYLGCARFLKHYSIQLSTKNETVESRFVLQRLRSHAGEFQHDDLWTLRQKLSIPPALLDAVVGQLSLRVQDFAQRLASDPMNLSDDLVSLAKSIRDYGFSPTLNEVLHEIDKELQETGTPFDQVGTMQHIRSFFEKLHEHVGLELQKCKPTTINGTPLDKCGMAIDYLCQKDVITEKLKNLAKSLYGILSDKDSGCHAIKATRDYTRLCRNMVVEYAIALFFELERRLTDPHP